MSERHPKPGVLYLIPSPLGEQDPAETLSEPARRTVATLDYFVVEHLKTARAVLKRIGTCKPLQELTLAVLDEHTVATELECLLSPVVAGMDAGLLSEAGCPAVADPGAQLVRLAHEHGIRVVPLVGPSSILLALMASGLNGQRFAFHGYLPAAAGERDRRITELERESAARDQTQIFIETPYRNGKLFAALVETCRPDTLLCVATDLTLPGERVTTRAIGKWKGKRPEIEKRPTVFLLLALAR
ncbi:MAG: SAM-dependent methyltransferase [Betaproteobacteria bacterium]|nr:SAM-dependent methyltransferase [Betaproteobacteria bacterium]